MVCVIVTTPLNNYVEATTSGSLTFAFKKRPWSNNQRAPFNSHFLSQSFASLPIIQGDTSSNPSFYNWRKDSNPPPKKCFYYGKDNHILKDCNKW
jgi:hypothetical protein